jgi:hypothetical protein
MPKNSDSAAISKRLGIKLEICLFLAAHLKQTSNE